jgi:hypothetical protein
MNEILNLLSTLENMPMKIFLIFFLIFLILGFGLYVALYEEEKYFED